MRPGEALTVSQIEGRVCRLFGVDRRQLVSATKVSSVATPRAVSIYLTRKHCGLPYQTIGKMYGGRHHATVMYSVRRVSKMETVKVRGKDRCAAKVLQELESCQ